jgi:hypothetical protein
MTFLRRAGRLACLAVALASTVAHGAEPLEPPPEVPENEDYAVELADSLDAERLEVSLGASGRSGDAPRRTRRVRFSGDSLEATVREGQGDPLAGGTLSGHGARGTFGMGKLAPRWGRGLVFGSPSEPWSLDAGERGRRGALRGRSGEGAWVEHGERVRAGALYGRFADRRLAALSLGAGPAAWGTVLDARGRSQSSVGWEGESVRGEWAVDGAGRWRGEAMIARSDGDAAWAGRVRGGHRGFRSMAEPRRAGPSRALALSLARGVPMGRMSAHGALWRFRPGIAGARAACELEIPSAEHGDLALGFEEQHGARRDAENGKPPRSGLRQGWWWEWRGAPREVRLSLRHESWGSRSWARDPVRSVTTARAEAAAGFGVTVAVTHSVYRARTGESIYLPETESDRLVLRALSGTGRRTRIDVAVPAGGGSLRAGLQLATREAREADPRWTVEWMKRTRIRRAH